MTPAAEPTGRLVLVRHGQTEWSRASARASARTSRVLERVAEPLLTRDVALFAHGHLLRILAATYLRREPRLAAHLLLDAGGLCVLQHERGVPAIRSWNETPP